MRTVLQAEQMINRRQGTSLINRGLASVVMALVCHGTLFVLLLPTVQAFGLSLPSPIAPCAHGLLVRRRQGLSFSQPATLMRPSKASDHVEADNGNGNSEKPETPKVADSTTLDDALLRSEGSLSTSQQAAPTSSDPSSLSPSLPTYGKLLVFTATTLLIWLSEPLLSLVDTTVVGLTVTSKSAVVQLASLGPATTLYDGALYLCYFLAIATTNQVTRAASAGDYELLQTVVRHVLGVAGTLGLVMTAVLGLGGPWLLHNMAGASASPQLVKYAVRYTWIRASVAVAAVVGMVLESVCLAMVDTKTPARAVAAASVVNVVGDLILTPRWGVQGAAAATACATLTSATIMFRAVQRHMQKWKTREKLQQVRNGTIPTSLDQPYKNAPKVALDHHEETRVIGLAPNETATKTEVILSSANLPINTTAAALPLSTSSDGAYQSETIATQRSILSPSQQVPISSMFSFPGRRALLDLVSISGPIFFVIVSKVACYSAMTIRCAEFGVVAMAAHSIMMRVFFFYGCFGDSLSQTAQTFFPATLYPRPSPSDFRTIFRRLFLVAAGIGIVNSQSSVLILRKLGRYLVSDQGIVSLMRNQSLYMGLAVLLHPFIMLLEGTVMASRDFKTLVTTYCATLGLHFGILKFFSHSFPAVWRTFSLFQCIRLTCFGLQVWRRKPWKQKSAEGIAQLKNASTADATPLPP